MQTTARPRPTLVFTLVVSGAPTCTLPAATISVQRIANGTAVPVNETSFTQAADSGANFRVDQATCQYSYNLAASSMGVGTYSVGISINNVAVGNVTFGLK